MPSVCLHAFCLSPCLSAYLIPRLSAYLISHPSFRIPSFFLLPRPLSLSPYLSSLCLQALLVYAVDPRAKVRKAAQHGAIEVTNQIAEMASVFGSDKFPKLVAETVLEFCQRELAQCSPKQCLVALYLASGE